MSETTAGRDVRLAFGGSRATALQPVRETPPEPRLFDSLSVVAEGHEVRTPTGEAAAAAPVAEGVGVRGKENLSPA